MTPSDLVLAALALTAVVAFAVLGVLRFQAWREDRACERFHYGRHDITPADRYGPHN